MTDLEFELDLALKCPPETASNREWHVCAKAIAQAFVALLKACNAKPDHGVGCECMLCNEYKATVKAANEPPQRGGGGT